MRPYLELIRLPAVFTAPSDVLAGLALAAAAGAQLGDGAIVALIAASICVYMAGMAANDVFDAKVDAVERPSRPIPSGRVSLGAAWGLVLALHATGIGLAAMVGAPAMAAVGGTIALTYLYNAALKDSLVGPLAMGACRWGNALIGVSVMGWPTAWWLWAVPATTAFFVMALTFTSRHEVDGATADQLRIPLAVMLLGAILPAVWSLNGVLPVTWAAASVALPLAWLVGPVSRALRTPSAGSVRGAVMAGIFGIAMVNGCLALAAGGWWQAAIAVGLLVPGRFVGRWFYAT